MKGWLRASHRALDDARSLPHRPVHPHTEKQPLHPGTSVPLSVEILPTSRVFERGHRLGLVLQAADRSDPTRFRHDAATDRDPAVFTGANTGHTSTDQQSYLLVPVVPAQPAAVRGS